MVHLIEWHLFQHAFSFFFTEYYGIYTDVILFTHVYCFLITVGMNGGNSNVCVKLCV